MTRKGDTLSREQQALARLLELPENRLCVDCGTKGKLLLASRRSVQQFTKLLLVSPLKKLLSLSDEPGRKIFFPCSRLTPSSLPISRNLQLPRGLLSIWGASCA